MLEKSFGLEWFFLLLCILLTANEKRATCAHTQTTHSIYSHGCLTLPYSGLVLSVFLSFSSFPFNDDDPIITISTFQITNNSKTISKQKQNNAKNNLARTLFLTHASSLSISLYLRMPVIRFPERNTLNIVLIVVWYIVYVYSCMEFALVVGNSTNIHNAPQLLAFILCHSRCQWQLACILHVGKSANSYTLTMKYNMMNTDICAPSGSRETEETCAHSNIATLNSDLNMFWNWFRCNATK